MERYKELAKFIVTVEKLTHSIINLVEVTSKSRLREETLQSMKPKRRLICKRVENDSNDLYIEISSKIFTKSQNSSTTFSD